MTDFFDRLKSHSYGGGFFTRGKSLSGTMVFLFKRGGVW